MKCGSTDLFMVMCNIVLLTQCSLNVRSLSIPKTSSEM